MRAQDVIEEITEEETTVGSDGDYSITASFDPTSNSYTIIVYDYCDAPIRRISVSDKLLAQETIESLLDQYGISDDGDYPDDDADILEREEELREFVNSFIEDVCLFDDHVADLDDKELSQITNSLLNILGRKYGFTIYRPVLIDGERVDYPYDREREVE